MTDQNPRKRVVLTGASGGMGQALCSILLQNHYHVLALGTQDDKLKNLIKNMNSPYLSTLNIDFAETDFLYHFKTHLQKLKWSELYGLVNLAGISIGASFDELTREDWLKTFQVNTTAPMQLCQICIPMMRQYGKGSIVNVSSPVGVIGARKASYASSKAALHGLTVSIARQEGPNQIRVNLLLPGPTLTYMTEGWSLEKQAQIAQESFLKRLCTSEEVAHMICFMLSEEASYLTGSVIDLTAGSMMSH